jgi:hypothetical protein
MRSSSALFALTVVASLTIATTAHADPPPPAQPAQGFAVDRLYLSAPGGGWLTMDALDMRGGLGGAASFSLDYAHAPFHVGGAAPGSQRLDVVKNQASANFGFAISYAWARLYLDLRMPLVGLGTSGTVDGHAFTSPPVDLAQNPDTLSDTRIGFDARLVGEARGAFRLGAGVQLIVPSGNRSDYLTDGTYRAMGRALVAGDVGSFTYAGHVGAHVRPLDEPETPGSPRGSELLFGAGAGWKTLLGADARAAVVVGPEITGASPFKALFGGATTAIEGMLVGRIEGTGDDDAQLRFKTGIGTGLVQQLGAPDFRVVVAIEVFDHRVDTDGDGVCDSQDACPHTPGEKTRDSKTNGCPSLMDLPPAPPPSSP